MFAAGTYTFTEPQNAEIQITNTYSEQTADLDLIKTSVTGTKFDGAEFKLYKKNDEEHMNFRNLNIQMSLEKSDKKKPSK